jgi:cytochrome c-type biogenesis protein CcmF
MVVEFGHFALILALCVAVVQAALPLAGSLRGVRSWMDSAPVLALAQLLFVGLAFACLARAFLQDDFRCAWWRNTRTPRCRPGTS